MPIAFPDEPDQTGPDAQDSPADSAPTRPDERDRARTRARGDDSTPAPQEEHAGGEVVAFPGGGAVAGAGKPTAGTEVVRVWFAEARETTARAVDGSVFRARPPALRDCHERLKRAEWSGGVQALRWAGWIYGYPALGVRAVLLALCWLLDHPTRLAIAAAVAALAAVPLFH